MHRHHAKRVFLVKRTKLWGPQVDCQELQKPPREPQGYQRYRTSGRGAIANQIKKNKTMSTNKHVDDQNIAGIAQVSIRDRFRPRMLTCANPVML